ncbi:TMEM175 family protein [Mucilaginibacter flavidus]|uniref:TMEM175 family protein n=1 Tax=Mucilaginibacter flavidus TaxID=2949309 RepID=UPI00209328E9|nr:TMEM175 family protein [Mucilaginibacter flavidus]MCO5945508.1 TMEM175 family protein [Mucilaginibacter flavidus]
MRKKIASITKKKESVFVWRSHEPSRLETFSDAVFAFAITLIMVSLEVPRTFDELFEVFKGFFAFACCFGILFMIWNNQNIYFRRYGLNNARVTSLNAMLLFVVLMYVYPLKFLFIVFGRPIQRSRPCWNYDHRTAAANFDVCLPLGLRCNLYPILPDVCPRQKEGGRNKPLARRNVRNGYLYIGQPVKCLPGYSRYIICFDSPYSI